MSQNSRPTTRALLGTMLLVVFLLIYVLLAMVLAAAVLPTGNGVAEFLYYAAAGLLWVPPAAVIIRWMYPRRPG
jgi:hypothetical protein